VQRTGQKPRLLVAYFSYTGNTKRVAERLLERLRGSCDVQLIEILPRRKRSYLHWLAYSFVPNSEVEIETPPTDLSGFNSVLLGFPKWTLGCPPLNKFIHQLSGVRVPKFFLFMTCGGFDEKRFLGGFTRKLEKMGCNIVESLTVKRKQIIEEAYHASVDGFAKRVEEQSRVGPAADQLAVS